MAYQNKQDPDVRSRDGAQPAEPAAGQPKDLIGAISDSFSAGKEIFVDAGEILLDTATEHEVLKEVPVVKWLTSAYTVRDAYQTKRLERNTRAFLSALGTQAPETIHRLRDKVLKDKKFAEEFEDTVTAIILEASKPLKAALLGNLVRAVADDSLDKASFEKLSQLIHSSSVPALRAIPSFLLANENPYKSGIGEIPEEPLIMSMGLATRSGTMFRMSRDGEALWRWGFRERPID
ncbi:hypothetical protein KBI52_21140 [Microvirga sp. HBU67558]|uniref:hypothetical protein n=1 Tax=Microvirga TaxID=186650 RepID=UPI001B39754E|nr:MULTISPECIES: hypothetical protein [unclassified Microvirga]MBQ0822695.1 hypothetical protein [Microvirga sp. HBU67558]